MSAQSVPTRTVKPSAISGFHIAFVVAWAFWLLFYLLQYAIRSAPGVMIPEQTAAFSLSALGVSLLLGVDYYTYSTFAIVAGASLDRWGAKYTIPVGERLLPASDLTLFLRQSTDQPLAPRLQQHEDDDGFSRSSFSHTNKYVKSIR